MDTIKINHKVTGMFEFFSDIDSNGNPINKIGEKKNEIQWNFLDRLGTGRVRDVDITGYNNVYYSSGGYNNDYAFGALYNPKLWLGDDSTAATKWDGTSATGGYPLNSTSTTDNFGVVKNQIMGPINKSSIYTYDADANGKDKHSVLFKVTPTSTFTINELGVTGSIYKCADHDNRPSYTYNTAISRATPAVGISVTEGTTIYILYTIAINTDASLDGWSYIGGDYFFNTIIGNGSDRKYGGGGIQSCGLSIDGTVVNPLANYYDTTDHIMQNEITYNDVQTVVNNGGQLLRGTEFELSFNDLPVNTYESITLFNESRSMFRKLNTLEVTDASNVYYTKILVSFT